MPDPGVSVPVPDLQVVPTIGPTAAGPDLPIPKLLGWSPTEEVGAYSAIPAVPIRLPADQQEIVIFFGAPASHGAPVEFRYRLTGYDDDWTVTRSPLAHFRRLPPGVYRFEVEARYPQGAWRAASAALTLDRRPFFYQTWYFYLLLALGLVGLAAQLLSQRDQLLKGQMGIILEERNRIASDCHDTLMAGFAAISWQLEATARLFRDSGINETPAAQSCELARSMVAHCQSEARRIIWDLRDSDELTNMLSLALSRAIGTRRTNDSVELSFDVRGEEIPIAPGAIHHLVCIGQEAVTNALRHAEASTVNVQVCYESDFLSLTIRDNGRGFQPQDTRFRFGHFGIPVMEERSRKLGGTLRVTSSEAGTEVAMTVGFNKIHQLTHQQHHVVQWIGV
jgi:signal transduction histidine kinase